MELLPPVCADRTSLTAGNITVGWFLCCKSLRTQGREPEPSRSLDRNSACSPSLARGSLFLSHSWV